MQLQYNEDPIIYRPPTRIHAVRRRAGAAHRAYVFEDGGIIEEGHHQQLLNQKGIYAQLYGERQSWSSLLVALEIRRPCLNVITHYV